ncbi:QRFP-like peptide receptor [Acropora muricata]|uniref:QRFP-like peptide receptor n=1 Tax=Acropora muricata TaxID=159855 RepID=UPI0034E421DC
MDVKGYPDNESFSPARHLFESSCFEMDSTSVKISRLVPYVFVITFSAVGNILVPLVVFRAQSMRKAVNFFIVNMAISDLLITLVYMPRVVSILLAGYRWLSKGLAGLVFCKLVYFVHETALSVSIFSAVCISGERFIAVIRPLRTWNRDNKLARILITVTWIGSLSMRIPILLANEIQEINGKTYCVLFLDEVFWPGSTAVYHKLNLIGMYATPLGVMVILYSATLCTLKNRNRPGNPVAPKTTMQPSDIRNRKVSRMVLMVLTAFLLCWMLYFVVAVMESYDIDILCDVRYFRLFLAHFNCALTPVFYALFSENYRREFKSILFACYGESRVRSMTSQQALHGRHVFHESRTSHAKLFFHRKT